MKFIKVEPLKNYKLIIQTDDLANYEFDVFTQIQRIPSYRCLLSNDLFRAVKFKDERIYWDMDCDFHIDQVLASARKI
jgi:hypothetical protein